MVPFFRPCKAEDVGSIAIPLNVKKLVRRDQDADPLDLGHRCPE